MTDEDDLIEKGYTLLMDRIKKAQEEEEKLSEKVKNQKAVLLSRMAKETISVVSQIGLSLLRRGKQDTKGEIYDPEYYREKMIVLGKTNPVPYRPDNPSMPVVDQFCVLSEKGKFYELMYSTDGFLTDSYLNPITPEDVLQIYGEEPLLMLYHAMKDYLKDREDLIQALQRVLDFILSPKVSQK
ncbi:MAG: hypothetical protein LUO93_10370 [Methanomicrobiales archaeon]|nr:hypothetical protein [Methanomicrobiales archaeon]